MKKIPKIISVMTPFPFDIGRREPIGNARRMMMERKIHHLPVVENHELKGLISDRDIKLLLGPEFDYPDPKELTVEDAMVDDPYVVDSETSVITVLDELAMRHIGAALVTKQGRLVGIFSTSDACREFSSWLKQEFFGSIGGSDIA
ncbi:MAG: acetoin utilization protein AcuB [Gammaproteobacteria bacterium]|jgi:acetoin utilization protein AcuB